MQVWRAIAIVVMDDRRHHVCCVRVSQFDKLFLLLFIRNFSFLRWLSFGVIDFHVNASTHR